MSQCAQSLAPAGKPGAAKGESGARRLAGRAPSPLTQSVHTPQGQSKIGKMSPTKIAGILAASDFFKDTALANLQDLARRAQVVTYSSGQNIFSTGDISETLYIVLEGRVRIVRFSEEGQEVAFGLIDPGEVLGEVAMIDGGPRSASAFAQEKCQLAAINRNDFFQFLESEPKMTVHLLVVMCGRLRDTIDQVHNIGLKSVEARLARALLGFAANYGTVRRDGVLIDLKIGQREIGAFVATTRESVGKQLSAWRDSGLIGRDGGKVVIRDMQALSDLAGDDGDDPDF